MATLFQHRLILVVPVAKVAVVAGWIQANIAANQVDAALGPTLNTSGLVGDAATHAWCSMALVDVDLKALLIKMCQLASVVPPTAPQWSGWTKADKIAWLVSVQAAVLAGYGVWLDLCDNTGAGWNSPDGVLTSLALLRKAS